MCVLSRSRAKQDGSITDINLNFYIFKLIWLVGLVGLVVLGWRDLSPRFAGLARFISTFAGFIIGALFYANLFGGGRRAEFSGGILDVIESLGY